MSTAPNIPANTLPVAPVDKSPVKFTRRDWLNAAGAGMAALLAWPMVRKLGGPKASVFIAKNQRYDSGLEQTIRDGLIASGLDVQQLRGKRVLLKPNLVEPYKTAPHMTTHPAMVLAAAEVFRAWGATVVVGEGPGHVRDTELALVESNLFDALADARLPFADLNYEEVAWTANRGNACKLAGFYFPRSIQEADLVVSMPKLKTHHWVGFTASMKNLYGTIPGVKYGWPKNVLHHNGIPETVFDINASLPKTISIVDGITCMEGDGPIMGSAKQMGLVIMGTVPTAVDATVARIMGLEPSRVPYLDLAAEKLGPIDDRRIHQRGERWQPLVSRFRILAKPHLLPMVS